MVLEGTLYSGDERMEYIKENEEERDRHRERRRSDGKKRERKKGRS